MPHPRSSRHGDTRHAGTHPPSLHSTRRIRETHRSEAVINGGGTFVAGIGIANVYDLAGVADLELGFVTEELLPPGDGYVSRVLDGGEFASLHFDGWAEKPSAYAALAEWLDTNARTPRGPSRERGPLPWPAEPRTADAVVVAPKPEGWRTEILLPI